MHHSMTEPLYLTFKGFTAVCTPHMIDQTLQRTNTAVVDFLHEHGANLTDVYTTCRPGACHWVAIERYIMYVKRRYNTHRHRNELELISLTPSNFVHTKTNKIACRLQNTTRKSQSAFPSWFAEDEQYSI